MYEYTNPEYYSKVNHFDDDYHKPETEVEGGFDKEKLAKLRTMKRKYRDFREFCEAKRIYNEYARYLIEKYGGKKRFKFLYQIGFVKEYVPFCPELRNIKKNRKYIKDGLPLEQPTYNVENRHKVFTEEELAQMDVKIDFSFVNKFKIRSSVEEELHDEIAESISEDLGVIANYYKGRIKDPTALDHRVKRKYIMQERYSENDYVPVKKRYKEYLKKKWRYEYEEDYVDPTAYSFYKSASVSAKEAIEIEVHDWLEKMGIKPKKKSLSKNARKVVRRNSGKLKKKKKPKKGKNIMRTKYMEKMTGKNYNRFEDFAEELMTLHLGDK